MISNDIYKIPSLTDPHRRCSDLKMVETLASGTFVFISAL